MKRLILACIAVPLAAFGIRAHAQAGRPMPSPQSLAAHGSPPVAPRPMTLFCVMDNIPVDSSHLWCGSDNNKPGSGGGGGGGNGGISCTDNTDAENQEVASPTCSITDPGSPTPAVTVGPGSSWGNIPNCNSLTDVTASTNCISDPPDPSSGRSGDDACALQLASNLQHCWATRSAPHLPPGANRSPFNNCIENANKIFGMCEKNMPQGGGDVTSPGSKSKMAVASRPPYPPVKNCDDFLRLNVHYCSRLNNGRAAALCMRTAELAHIQCSGSPIPASVLQGNILKPRQ